MRNWPAWIPFFSSWMSAILLILLTSCFDAIMPPIQEIIQFFYRLSPRLGFFVLLLAGLLPILLIAVFHHILHWFLDQFFPQTLTPEIGRVQGLFPGLMSWWEGLYGWLVLLLSLLISYAILVLFSSSSNSYYYLLELWSINVGVKLFTIPNLVRVIVAAYLYQFEQIVRQRLMSVGSTSNR